jgi:hypothetical protein
VKVILAGTDAAVALAPVRGIRLSDHQDQAVQAVRPRGYAARAAASGAIAKTRPTLAEGVVWISASTTVPVPRRVMPGRGRRVANVHSSSGEVVVGTCLAGPFNAGRRVREVVHVFVSGITPRATCRRSVQSCRRANESPRLAPACVAQRSRFAAMLPGDSSGLRPATGCVRHRNSCVRVIVLVGGVYSARVARDLDVCRGRTAFARGCNRIPEMDDARVSAVPIQRG